MLLDFKVSNYKSFLGETVLSLQAAPKQKGLDYSLHRFTVAKQKYKVLCSAVMYGPNAAGKSSLIGAMEVFKSIVMRGNIKDGVETDHPNKASFDLALIPYAFSEKAPFVSFSVKFLKNKRVFEYSLKIDLGGFMESKHERKVVEEKLMVNGDEVFLRNKKGISIGKTKHLKGRMIKGYRENEEIVSFFFGGVASEDLFLTSGFKLLISPEISQEVVDWFENDLIVVYRANDVETMPVFPDPEEATAIVVKSLNDAAKIFGVSSNQLGYILKEDEGKMGLFSLFEEGEGGGGIAITADVFESYGTVRFLSLFNIIVDALKHGKTLAIDEFDASIHPMALMNLVNIFHDDEINRKGAQLIFNTHNPIFLNRNLFRRDEIKFVEKDSKTGESTCYALSDFGTAGTEGVRATDDYMKNYFVNKYGAIEDVDFSELIEKILYGEWDNDEE